LHGCVMGGLGLLKFMFDIYHCDIRIIISSELYLSKRLYRK
jgi:hypothetical protein